MSRLGALVAALVLVFVAVPPGAITYSATQQTNQISFNLDQQLVNPSQPNVFGVQELEPGITTDSAGDIYVDAIRGVPAGSDMWQTTTQGCQNAVNHQCPFFYMGQPEGLANNTGVGTGGGDIDVAVGAPYAKGDCAGNTPSCAGSTNGNIYISSLTLANETGVTCRDGNLAPSSCTVQNPFSTGSADEDREWLAAEGKHTVYVSFHNVGPQNISVCKSVNDGIEYAPCTQAITDALPQAASNNELGNIVVDNAAAVSPTPQTCATPPCHYIYQIFVSVATAQENTVSTCPLHTVWMGISSDGGATWTDHMVYNAPVQISGSTCTGPSLNYIFPVVAVDGAGNVYAEWTDGKNVFYAFSKDHGTTWSKAIQVSKPYQLSSCPSTPPTTCGLHTAIFPWMAATGNGHVDFVWYGSNTSAFDSSSSSFGTASTAWSVFFAETINGTAANPAIFQTIANKHPNHVGIICTGGTGCSAGRTLGDFFKVAIEPSTGCAVIAYANDRNSKLPTQAYFNRQVNHCTGAASLRLRSR